MEASSLHPFFVQALVVVLTLREWFGTSRSNATSFQQVLNKVTYRCNRHVAIEHLVACEAKVY
jgi:hypothetical protein